MNQKIIKHYIEFSQYTYSGLYQDVLRKNLPNDIRKIGELVRKQIIHRTTLEAGNVGTNAGKIIAKGTAAEKIIFTSAQDKPEYADWDELTLFHGSRLEYVEVAYAHNAVNVSQSDIQITNSTIHDSLWSCVDIYSKDILVEDNQIYHCWHQAVGTKKVSLNTIIRRNFIHDAQVGVNCENGSKPTIVDNKLTAAPIGEECGSGSNNEIIEQPADTIGGTYAGQLIYPSNKP